MLPRSVGFPPRGHALLKCRGKRRKRLQESIVDAGPNRFVDGDDFFSLGVVDVLAVVGVATVRSGAGSIFKLSLRGAFGMHA